MKHGTSNFLLLPQYYQQYDQRFRKTTRRSWNGESDPEADSEVEVVDVDNIFLLEFPMLIYTVLGALTLLKVSGGLRPALYYNCSAWILT